MAALTKNEGRTDRAIRVMLGLFLISLMFLGPRTLWGAIGFIPLLTGLVGLCPLYSLLGLNTCPRDGNC